MSTSTVPTVKELYQERWRGADDVDASLLDCALFAHDIPPATHSAVLSADLESLEHQRAREDVLATALVILDDCARQHLDSNDDDAIQRIINLAAAHRAAAGVPGVQLFSASTAADDERVMDMLIDRLRRKASSLTMFLDADATAMAGDGETAAGAPTRSSSASASVLDALLLQDAGARARSMLEHAGARETATTEGRDDALQAAWRSNVRALAALVLSELQQKYAVQRGGDVETALRNWYHDRAAGMAALGAAITPQPVIIVIRHADSYPLPAFEEVTRLCSSLRGREPSVPTFLILQCSTSREAFLSRLPPHVPPLLELETVRLTDSKRTCAEFADALFLAGALPARVHPRAAELLRDALLRSHASSDWYATAVRRMLVAHYNPSYGDTDAVLRAASRRVASEADLDEQDEDDAFDAGFDAHAALSLLAAPLEVWAAKFAHVATQAQGGIAYACRAANGDACSTGPAASPLWATCTRMAAWLRDSVLRALVVLPSMRAATASAAALKTAIKRMCEDAGLEAVYRRHAHGGTDAHTPVLHRRTRSHRPAGVAPDDLERSLRDHGREDKMDGEAEDEGDASRRGSTPHELRSLRTWGDTHLTHPEAASVAEQESMDSTVTGIPRHHLPFARNQDGAFAEIDEVRFESDLRGSQQLLVALCIFLHIRRRIGWLTAMAVACDLSKRPLRDDRGALTPAVRATFEHVVSPARVCDDVSVVKAALDAVCRATATEALLMMQATYALLCDGTSEAREVRKGAPSWSSAVLPRDVFARHVRAIAALLTRMTADAQATPATAVAGGTFSDSAPLTGTPTSVVSPPLPMLVQVGMGGASRVRMRTLTKATAAETSPAVPSVETTSPLLSSVPSPALRPSPFAKECVTALRALFGEFLGDVADLPMHEPYIFGSASNLRKLMIPDARESVVAWLSAPCRVLQVTDAAVPTLAQGPASIAFQSLCVASGATLKGRKVAKAAATATVKLEDWFSDFKAVLAADETGAVNRKPASTSSRNRGDKQAGKKRGRRDVDDDELDSVALYPYSDIPVEGREVYIKGMFEHGVKELMSLGVVRASKSRADTVERVIATALPWGLF